MVFGKLSSTDTSSFAPIYLNDAPIDFVKQWKYLGVTIVTGSSLSFSAIPELRSFYRATNSILSVLNKPSEVVLMKLLYCNCVPILTYAAAVKEFSSREMSL